MFTLKTIVSSGGNVEKDRKLKQPQANEQRHSKKQKHKPNMKDTCPDDDQEHSYNSKDTRKDEEIEEKDGEAKEASIKSKKLSKEGEGINVSCKSDGSKNAEVRSQDAMELTIGDQSDGGDAGTKKSDESIDEDQEGHTPNKSNDNEPENENYERKCEEEDE